MNFDLINKDMLSDLIGVAKTAGEFINDQAVDIVNQALNYALFEAMIALGATLSLYLGYYFIHKIITAAESADKIENTEASLKRANALKMVRQLVLVLFTGIVLYRAQGSIKAIGKITISPKVYLLEEGVKILDKVRNQNAGK